MSASLADLMREGREAGVSKQKVYSSRFRDGGTMPCPYITSWLNEGFFRFIKSGRTQGSRESPSRASASR